mgnify:CR=1 FL=1
MSNYQSKRAGFVALVTVVMLSVYLALVISASAVIAEEYRKQQSVNQSFIAEYAKQRSCAWLYALLRAEYPAFRPDPLTPVHIDDLECDITNSL